MRVHFPTFSKIQRKEMKQFYNFCVEEKTDFDDYTDVCEKMRKYLLQTYKSNGQLYCSPPLLSMSAIVIHRGDKLEDVVRRDMTVNESVRFEVKEQSRKKIKREFDAMYLGA